MPPVAVTGSLSFSDIAVANREVEATEERENEEGQSNSEKHYHCYSSKEQADIGRYAAQCGPTWASCHYTNLMGRPYCRTN